jgi:hypothetical protein
MVPVASLQGMEEKLIVGGMHIVDRVALQVSGPVCSASAAPPCRTQLCAVSRSGSAAQTSIGLRAQT